MQLICEIFMEIGLPAGVVNVVHGNRDIPGSWYEDPRMAGVCLVGSTPTAKAMAAGCAKGAKRSMLLGGAKNLLLVMEDSNMDVFINNFLNSCYGSAGQRCLAGSIVAAVPEVYEEVLERMIEASKTVKVGDAFDPDVYMGPLISRKAADNVLNYVDIALKHGQGCKLVLDRRRVDLPEKNKNGFFVGPTIIRDVTPCNPLFTTEVFGPLVATIKVADIHDAIELVNSSEYGNGACIFTQNMHYAEVFSRDTDVGMVGVNVGICAPHPYVPFGGIKGSLLGTDKVQGKGGIDFFTQHKVTTTRTYDPKGKAGQAAPVRAARALLRGFVAHQASRGAACPRPAPTPSHPGGMRMKLRNLLGPALAAVLFLAAAPVLQAKELVKVPMGWMNETKPSPPGWPMSAAGTRKKAWISKSIISIPVWTSSTPRPPVPGWWRATARCPASGAACATTPM